MQGGGRLLRPLQLPDKEHRLLAVDALQESRPSLRARNTGAQSQGVPPARGAGGSGRRSPRARFPTGRPHCRARLPSTALGCPELVKRVSAFVIP